MARVAHQSNICDPSWRINHLGTTLQSRLAHRLAYRQLLMNRPHLINRIWFRCDCAGLFPVTYIASYYRRARLTAITNLFRREAIFHRARFLASTHLFDLYRSTTGRPARRCVSWWYPRNHPHAIHRRSLSENELQITSHAPSNLQISPTYLLPFFFLHKEIMNEVKRGILSTFFPSDDHESSWNYFMSVIRLIGEQYFAYHTYDNLNIILWSTLKY